MLHSCQFAVLLITLFAPNLSNRVNCLLSSNAVSSNIRKSNYTLKKPNGDFTAGSSRCHYHHQHRHQHQHQHQSLRFASSSDTKNKSPKSESKQPTRIYFDISLDDETIGRLIFNLGYESEYVLPKHSHNIVKLSTEDLKGIDPKCSYVKCYFKHSPQFVETMPQYRWAHVLDGRGRNAIGRVNEKISDSNGMRSCSHNLYGGVYYGLKYDPSKMGEGGVVLTVPLVGAYRGSTSFSIVRVGESPQEWGEKLLLNSAVLGWLESGLDVLHIMARQTRAPPRVIASGRLS